MSSTVEKVPKDSDSNAAGDSVDNRRYYDAFSENYDRGRERGYHKLIDDQDAYFSSIRSSWGQQLRKVFDELPNPQWWAKSSTSQPCTLPWPVSLAAEA